jgi:hypothetical protein
MGYFFVHLLVASSHFMFFTFSQAALVFGALAASAATWPAMENKRPAARTLLRSFVTMENSLQFRAPRGALDGATMHEQALPEFCRKYTVL